MKTHAGVAAFAAALFGAVYVLLGLSPEVWPDASYGAKSDDVHWKLGMASGTASVVLLGSALSVSPLRQMRGARRRPVHIPIRRSLGVASAVVGVVHVGFAMTIHADGWDLLSPYLTIYEAQGTGRLLGLGAILGSFTAVILVGLALISTQAAMVKLGRVRWKRLQTGAYLAAVGALTHVLAIQIWERRAIPHALAMSMIPLTVVAIRIRGRGVSKRRWDTDRSVRP